MIQPRIPVSDHNAPVTAIRSKSKIFLVLNTQRSMAWLHPGLVGVNERILTVTKSVTIRKSGSDVWIYSGSDGSGGSVCGMAQAAIFGVHDYLI